MPIRQNHMPTIIAGLGVADMDYRCAPVITEALQKRVAFPNWGYNLRDFDLFLGTAGDRCSRKRCRCVRRTWAEPPRCC